MGTQNNTMSSEGENNVVYLSSAKSKAPKQRPEVKLKDFVQLMDQNRKNQERLRTERNKANLSVIRSHKLKK